MSSSSASLLSQVSVAYLPYSQLNAVGHYTSWCAKSNLARFCPLYFGTCVKHHMPEPSLDFYQVNGYRFRCSIAPQIVTLLPTGYQYETTLSSLGTHRRLKTMQLKKSRSRLMKNEWITHRFAKCWVWILQQQCRLPAAVDVMITDFLWLLITVTYHWLC